MIDTPKAIKELEDSGLTPVTFPDPKHPHIDHIFIKRKQYINIKDTWKTIRFAHLD